MNINFGFDWVILILFIAALIYTMKVIRSEKNTVLKNGVRHTLGNIEFLIPPWWSATTSTTQELIF